MSTPSATILVVDDMPTNLALLFDGLRAAGYRVLVNDDGQAALETAASAQPHMIILDVMMPGMDGFEVCRRLKRSPATADIPVIFMTALGDPSDEVRGLALGAVDYLSKPINIEVALARISTHLTLWRLRRALELKNAELEEALATIRSLSSIVPICAWCGKNIRNERDEWVSMASYFRERAGIEFSHTICPSCVTRVDVELGG